MREKVHTIMGDLYPVIDQPYIGLKPMIISTSVILHDAIEFLGRSGVAFVSEAPQNIQELGWIITLTAHKF